MYYMDENELVNYFGLSLLQKLFQAVTIAYSMGTLLYHDNPIFSIDSAYAYRQELMNLATDYCLGDACHTNKLPLEFRYCHNKNKSCKHIELFNDKFILTHISCKDSEFPRSAIYRKELANTSQMKFWDDFSSSPIKYGIITHKTIRKGETSVNLGIPDEDCCHWSNKLNLNKLISAPKIVPNEEQYQNFEIGIRRLAEEKGLD